MPPKGNVGDTVGVKLAFAIRMFLSRTERGRCDPGAKMGERWGRDAEGRQPDAGAQIPYSSACVLLQRRRSPETDPGRVAAAGWTRAGGRVPAPKRVPGLGGGGSRTPF